MHLGPPSPSLNVISKEDGKCGMLSIVPSFNYMILRMTDD